MNGDNMETPLVKRLAFLIWVYNEEGPFVLLQSGPGPESFTEERFKFFDDSLTEAYEYTGDDPDYYKKLMEGCAPLDLEHKNPPCRRRKAERALHQAAWLLNMMGDIKLAMDLVEKVRADVGA